MSASLLQRQSILVVDDDRRWRHLVRKLFDFDALVAECHDGADAILGFRSLQPDWVIMDIAMEPIDGLTAARRIKSEFPDARIIFLTQFNDKEFRDEAVRLGAAGYVLKDDLDQVETIIRGTAPTACSETFSA